VNVRPMAITSDIQLSGAGNKRNIVAIATKITFVVDVCLFQNGTLSLGL